MEEYMKQRADFGTLHYLSLIFVSPSPFITHIETARGVFSWNTQRTDMSFLFKHPLASIGCLASLGSEKTGLYT